MVVFVLDDASLEARGFLGLLYEGESVWVQDHELEFDPLVTVDRAVDSRDRQAAF